MKIMLIDDELPILESLKSALKPTGYACEVFQNPHDAVAAFRGGGCEVVVTDFMMPGMNGIEVLKAVKDIDANVFVIILTGYADIENAIAAVNNGAYAFFRKPLDFRDFVGTLRKIEDRISGVRQKELDMDTFFAEYSRLKTAFDSLQQMVHKMSAVL